MPIRLHAIAVADAQNGTSTSEYPVSGIVPMFVPFRDLCAVVSEQKAFGLDETTQESVVAHQAVVDAVFRRGSVLPAPVGVVFRAPDVLKRWMELHYVSLTDALEFVEDRCAARVHIERADGKPGDLEAGSDLAAAATESLRALRRKAVASVPLRTEAVTGLALSAAFLVDHDMWKDFLHAVDEQRDAHSHLHFDVTGPWAPYDFVRMQFGG
jgi:Gas vesicle synthesis protein GvpL/GvpF